MSAGEFGVFSGYASVFGNLDRAREVVDPGAFAGTLAAFRRSGLLTWQHDTARPVGFPLEVREDGVGLYLRGAFHSTADGQMARTVLAERDAAGLKFGLSIGYRVVADAYKGGFRHLTDLELYEIALVSIPANELATPTPGTVKGIRIGPPIALATRPGADGSRTAPRAEVLRMLGQAVAVGVPVGRLLDTEARAALAEPFDRAMRRAGGRG